MFRITSHHLLDLLYSVLRRLWWGGLLAVHIHPLVSTSRGLLLEEFSLGRGLALAGLLVLATFFVLKIIDVRFLRPHTRREVLIAFWLIAAMVHSNAAASAIEVAAIAPAPVAVLVSSTLIGAGLVRSRRIRRHLHLLITRISQRLAAQYTQKLRSGYCQTLLGASQNFLRFISSLQAAPRGPPLVAAGN